MRQMALAAILSGAFASAVAAEEPPQLPVYEAKRVRPPEPGTTRRITVQIDPEEQAAYLAALPKLPDPRESRPASPHEGPEATADAATAYPWFWNFISPAISAASPARLGPAIAALNDGAGGASVPTPRLQSMQTIAEKYGSEILQATVGTRVSPALVLAVIGIESAGQVNAVSNKGACGLMQLMPGTAERFGVSDITNPGENIRGGVAYLDWLIGEFGADPMLVLAGYNAGEGAVREYGGVPPYRETRDYVPKVLAAWSVARGLCVTPPELLSDGCVFNVQVAGL
jgi:soluble lytic murein transglycosylase-like protein